MTGLEAIIRLGAVPRVVFIDIDSIDRGVNLTFIEETFRPGYWKVQSLVPPLRARRNWIVLLIGYLTWNYTNPVYRGSSEIALPKMDVETYNREVLMPRIAPYLFDESTKEQRDNFIEIFRRSTLPILVSNIENLQRHGTRIVFFGLFDPRISGSPLPRSLINFLLSVFPEIEYIENIDDEIPVYRHEGLHLLEGSGLMYFNKIMQKTGLSQSTKCTTITN